MLDGILSDVGRDPAAAPAEMAKADTNIGLFAHLAIDAENAIAIFDEVLKLDPGNEHARVGLEAAYKAQVHVDSLREGKRLLLDFGGRPATRGRLEGRP